VSYRIAAIIGIGVLASCSQPDLDRESAAIYHPAALERVARLSPVTPLFDTQRVLASNGYVYALGSGARFLHVFEQATGREIASFGRSSLAAVGAPDFMPSPVWLDADPSDGSVWIYDAKRRNLVRLTLAVGDAAATISRADSIHLESPVFVWTPAWAGDRHIVATGLFPNGRIGAFDSTGKLQTVYGSVPVDGDSATPHVAQQAFRGRIATNSARTLFAVARRHADAIEVWDHREKLRDIVGPIGFAPRYHVAKRGQGFDVNFRADTRYGYVDVAASGDRIFGLFSGREMGKAGTRASLGRMVNVFDWNGNLKMSLQLDCDAVGIAVSDDGRTLYAACTEAKRPDWIAAYSLDAE
jgi:hypothetical protein